MDRDDLAEFFSSYGPVSVKRMFSGFGVYAQDVCFAVFLRGELFLKADPSSVSRFEAEGSTPFSYSQTRSGKTILVNSWWRLPARLYDEPDELADWTRAAVAVAHAAKIKKSRGGKARNSKRSTASPKRSAGAKGAGHKKTVAVNARRGAAARKRKLNRKKA